MFHFANRRLLNKKVTFDFKKPFDLVWKYKKIWLSRRATARRSGVKNQESLIVSDLLNETRTHFEQKIN